MITKDEAKIEAWAAIADLFGIDYFRKHFEGSCQAYPLDSENNVLYEYFLGFEGNEESGLWTVFARVIVNRDTKEVKFLDYRKPDGSRMKRPVKPISFV